MMKKKEKKGEKRERELHRSVGKEEGERETKKKRRRRNRMRQGVDKVNRVRIDVFPVKVNDPISKSAKFKKSHFIN
jgi:hypothetical protein